MFSKTNIIPTKRGNKTFDIMKGLLIFGVIATHVLFLNENYKQNGSVPIGMLYLCLISFFIIAGYFYNPERGYLENIKKRFKQIVIPMSLCIAILPLFLYVYLHLVGQPQPFSDYIDNVINFLLGGARFGTAYGEPYHENLPMMISLGMYFLMATFSSFLVFYAIADKAAKNAKTLVVTIAILLIMQAVIVETIHVYLPYYIQLIPVVVAFMLVGHWISKNNIIVNIEKQGWRNPRLFAIAIVALIIEAVLVWLDPKVVLVNCRLGSYGGLSVVPFFIECVAAFVWFYCFCFLISNVKIVSTPFLTIGRHTLALLLFHEFIIKMMIAPFYTLPTYPMVYPFPVLSIGIGLIVVVLTIIIIFALTILFEKLKERVEEKIPTGQ